MHAVNFLASQALDMTLDMAHPVPPAPKWTSEIAPTAISEFDAAVAIAASTMDAHGRKMPVGFRNRRPLKLGYLLLYFTPLTI